MTPEIHTGPSKRYNIILDGEIYWYTAGIVTKRMAIYACIISYFCHFLSDMKTAVIILGALVATVLGKNNFRSYITFRERERERERASERARARDITYYSLSCCTRVWYLSHQRAAKANANLRICADSPEPSLLAHTKYGCRRRLRPKIRPLAHWIRHGRLLQAFAHMR